MAGTTITGTVHGSVTLGVGGYDSPLTIASTGTIQDYPDYGGPDVYVPAAAAGGTVVNKGLIEGEVIADGPAPGAGYGVLMVAAATLSNTGTILGGFGGSFIGNRYRGGAGVAAFGGSVTNTGLIRAGAGGTGYLSSAYGGELSGGGGTGGYGVNLAGGARLSNSGEIFGGAGGASTFAYMYPDAGDGGIGLSLAGATASNDGLIGGGAGGYASNGAIAGMGGDGVEITGSYEETNSVVTTLSGNFTNRAHGVIVGGAGGGLSGPGEGGYGGTGLVVFDPSSSFANLGTITGGAGGVGNQAEDGSIYQPGGGGGIGVYVFNGATGRNSGVITGGAGGAGDGPGYARGGDGGIGLYVFRASFSNGGQIEGGARGVPNSPGYYGPQGYGGDGVVLAKASMTNGGTITGGYGGGGGVALIHSTLVNTGTVLGGTGRLSYGLQGYPGGAGVTVYRGSTLINSGQITGGYGGYGYGGNGGAGILIDGGVVIDSGTLTGGHFGYGHVSVGDNGDAVTFGATDAGTLVVEPGAVFSGYYGYVAANPTVADVLQLAGDGGTLSGIGTRITNFDHIRFAAGATWAIEGNVAGLADGERIGGFGVSDKIILDGTAAKNGTAAVTKHGEVSIFAGGKTYELNIVGARIGDKFTFTEGALTETPSAMTFLAPAASPAAGVPVVVGDAGGHATMAPPISASSAAYGGWLREALPAAAGEVQVMVTFQT